jgi:hypothetical protein
MVPGCGSNEKGRKNAEKRLLKRSHRNIQKSFQDKKFQVFQHSPSSKYPPTRETKLPKTTGELPILKSMAAPRGSRLNETKVLAILRELHRILARYQERKPPANEVRQRNRFYYISRVLADYQKIHPRIFARLEAQARNQPLPSDPLDEILTLAEARRRGLLTIEDLAGKLRRTYQTVRKALAEASPPVPHILAVDGKTKLFRREDAASWLRARWGFEGR